MVLAGCGTPNPNPVYPLVKLFARTERDSSDWLLRVRVRNARVPDAPIHDVTVVAYNDTGTEVCRKQAGDLSTIETNERIMHLTCDGFPAIITATAEESPCDGANIQILYWIGTDEQRGADLPPDVKVWESYYRECGESLPPERALENVNVSNTTKED